MSTHPGLDEKNWHGRVIPYARADVGKSLWQLIHTLPPYFALWIAMLWSLKVSYWLTLALTIPAAALRVRAYIIFHDCCHGSFFQSRRANETVGALLGVLVYTPYYHWKHDHLVHHATAANLDRRGTGDVPTWTLEEYRAASRWKQLGYRVVRSPYFLFPIGSAIIFVLWHRIPNPRADQRGRRSVHYNNLALLTVIVFLGWLIGFKELFLIELPIVVLAASLGVWMFYVQHQFEGVYWVRKEEWNFLRAGIEGSSYYRLPALLNWITGNIGYHHIHHLSPKIPNYNLPACHEANPALQVKPLTIRASLKCARLHLWDEANRQLVGFEKLGV